jgi:hypothetical protein
LFTSITNKIPISIFSPKVVTATKLAIVVLLKHRLRTAGSGSHYHCLNIAWRRGSRTAVVCFHKCFEREFCKRLLGTAVSTLVNTKGKPTKHGNLVSSPAKK